MSQGKTEQSRHLMYTTERYAFVFDCLCNNAWEASKDILGFAFDIGLSCICDTFVVDCFDIRIEANVKRAAS